MLIALAADPVNDLRASHASGLEDPSAAFANSLARAGVAAKSLCPGNGSFSKSGHASHSGIRRRGLAHSHQKSEKAPGKIPSSPPVDLAGVQPAQRPAVLPADLVLTVHGVEAARGLANTRRQRGFGCSLTLSADHK